MPRCVEIVHTLNVIVHTPILLRTKAEAEATTPLWRPLICTTSARCFSIKVIARESYGRASLCSNSTIIHKKD